MFTNEVLKVFDEFNHPIERVAWHPKRKLLAFSTNLPKQKYVTLLNYDDFSIRKKNFQNHIYTFGFDYFEDWFFAV